jgi:hypothetical protein
MNIEMKVQVYTDLEMNEDGSLVLMTSSEGGEKLGEQAINFNDVFQAEIGYNVIGDVKSGYMNPGDADFVRQMLEATLSEFVLAYAKAHKRINKLEKRGLKD